MELSVVVPTLNARDALASCLDALAGHAPDAEFLVVNGPSSDGTTGMVQERDDVSVLIELADRDINAARNAGIDRARGDVVAFLDHRVVISDGWPEAVAAGLDQASVVSGPTAPSLDRTIESPEQRTIAGRTVAYLNPGNVAFQIGVLDALDGFDEYLPIGGMRDAAHRLAGNNFSVRWDAGMGTTPTLAANGGEFERDWGWHYRSLAYRLVKSYSLRPTTIRRLLGHAGRDAASELRSVLGGSARPSRWLANGRTVTQNLLGGSTAGLLARRRDRTSRRNPYGRSTRADRAVTVYDWR